MKGISPLVAVIMLILVTLFVAGILAAWATQFAQTQRERIEVCLDAKVMIRPSVYNSANQQLVLTLENWGKAPLSLNVLLTYSNLNLHPAGIERYSQVLSITAGSIQAFTLANVTSDLQELSVQDRNCAGAQDMVRASNIRGLGLPL